MNPQSEGGAWGAVQAKAASLLAIGQTRLELLGNELEVARIKAMRELTFTLALLFCIGLGVVLTIVALALLFWEQRLLVVGLACTSCWALALYLHFAMRRDSAKADPIFADSLAELREDMRQLRSASDHGRTPG